MIPAKEVRERLSSILSEEVKTYLRDKVEPQVLFAAKCGRSSYSFVVYTDSNDSIYLNTFVETLESLGYTTTHTTTSPTHCQLSISW